MLVAQPPDRLQACQQQDRVGACSAQLHCRCRICRWSRILACSSPGMAKQVGAGRETRNKIAFAGDGDDVDAGARRPGFFHEKTRSFESWRLPSATAIGDRCSGASAFNPHMLAPISACSNATLRRQQRLQFECVSRARALARFADEHLASLYVARPALLGPIRSPRPAGRPRPDEQDAGAVAEVAAHVLRPSSDRSAIVGGQAA